MQENKEEDEGTMQADNQMDGCDDTKNVACDVSAAVDDSVVVGKIMNVKLSSQDEFYEKLTRFYHSSGLTLIFNFRKTRVDLYHFYKDVTERGGYCQVTKDGKWHEVASSLNAESGVIIPPNQIQMLYANLFYQFEQTYYYRTNSKFKEPQPFKAPLTGRSCTNKSSGSPTKKQKRDENDDDGLVEKRVFLQSSLQLPTGRSSCTNKSSGSPTKKQKRDENDDDGLVEKKVFLQSSLQLPTAIKSMEKNPPLQVPPEETNVVLETPTKAMETTKSSIKELKQHANAPMGLRTSYMIFLRMECERLKMIHGKGSPGQIKGMANDAWKRLSEHDRQPYIEASKRDKERYTREMAEFKVAQDQIATTQIVSASTNLTNVNNFAKPSLQTDGDHHPTLSDDAYHVTLPHGASDNVVTDKELAADIMQNVASNDPTFHEELAADIMQKAESNDPPFQINWDGST